MSDRIWVGTRKGLFRVERSGAGWGIRSAGFLGEPVSIALDDARDGHVYAALDLGHFGAKLHRSVDAGETWKEIGAPGYPQKPAEVDPETPWNLMLIWSLEPGGRDREALLWAGTIPGGLFRSTDRGETWELVSSLWDRPERSEWSGGGYDHPGVHSICVNPNDSNHIAVGISIGGVWISEDGGETWACRARGMRADYLPPEVALEPNQQDPHRIVRAPSNPDVYWCQHHNGVFRSTDGAASWSEIVDIAPSTFGFAVAVHPADPDTAWLVPAVKDECRVPVDGRLVVTRTRDGGQTWEALTRGLPQEGAYDLVYRHSLDVDASGQRLAMGSTTGNLWISEDGGDSWETVSANLPPIACVRFGAL